jgi:protein-disulfide isomerase
MGIKMQVTSTPTIIVNGKLKASKRIHDRERLMKVLDFLVEKEAKAMGLIEKK